MSRDEFLEQFDAILELPSGTLKGSERLEDLEQWDSLAMMNFIALANEHGNVVLSPRQFVSCVTVEDLLALVNVPKP